MQPLAPYIERVYGLKKSHSSETNIFRCPKHAPYLDKTRTNTILVYPGSFSPPHRGHLGLLNYCFYHGVHDLNVVAAIVLPSSDESVAAKGASFRFGRRERCFLWKKDSRLPDWAWVYEDSTKTFSNFKEQLKTSTKEDGYDIEFTYLYGAEFLSPNSSPSKTPSGTIMLCDAARVASYQRSSGRLKDFDHFSKWQRIKVDKDQLASLVRAKVERLHGTPEWSSRPDGQEAIEYYHDYVEKLVEARLAIAHRDLQDVLSCHGDGMPDGSANVRFIKSGGEDASIAVSGFSSNRADPGKVYRSRKNISSTVLRDAMSEHRGEKLKRSLQAMALSPQMLWLWRNSWLQEAKGGRWDRRCSTFLSSLPPSGEDDQVDGKEKEKIPLKSLSRKRSFSAAMLGESTVPERPMKVPRGASV